MLTPKFNRDGIDKKTFAPFELEQVYIRDEGERYWDYHLVFWDWEWLWTTYKDHYDGEHFEGYYLNGYGMDGVVKACRLQAGLEPEPKRDSEKTPSYFVDYNSEACTCFIHFASLEDAIQTATLACEAINDVTKLIAMTKLADENNWG